MRLAVFDLDGTLVDSAPDIAAAVNRMLAARGLAPLPVPDVAAMVGDGIGPLMQRAFAAHGRTPDEAAGAEYLADYEANVLVETRLFPGIQAALETLAAEGWILAVCTNKPERATRLLLAALGIETRFAAIGGGDRFAAHKPDPRHLAGTIDLAGGTPDRAVMIGDHRNDIAAARGAGVPAIFAGWGYGRPGMETGAAAIAPDAAAVPALADALAGC